MWMSDWIRGQPKADTLLTAQDLVRQGAQAWHNVSEYDKQVSDLVYQVFVYSDWPHSNTKRNTRVPKQSTTNACKNGVRQLTQLSCGS